MKNSIVIILLCLLCLSCSDNSPAIHDSNGVSTSTPHQLTLGTLYEGNHPLKSFSIGNDFCDRKFFIIGAKTAIIDNYTPITFMWQNYTGEYITSTLPLKQVRVKFDETAITPYIKFRYANDYKINSESEELPELKSVVYILVVCKESDWILSNNREVYK